MGKFYNRVSPDFAIGKCCSFNQCCSSPKSSCKHWTLFYNATILMSSDEIYQYCVDNDITIPDHFKGYINNNNNKCSKN